VNDVDLATPIELSLSAGEVVILSACLETLIEHAERSGDLDAAEMQAFWNLEAALEKANAHILADNWNDILVAAKNEISGRQP
jgi:hypothetical protein